MQTAYTRCFALDHLVILSAFSLVGSEVMHGGVFPHAMGVCVRQGFTTCWDIQN